MIIISRFLVGINAGTVYIFYLQMQFQLMNPLYFAIEIASFFLVLL